MRDTSVSFSPGPAVLPLPVLERMQEELLSFPGVGRSVLEISHRSTTWDNIARTARENLATLMDVPENYRILFLQCGATLQFSTVPLNLLQEPERTADYIITGWWSKKALKEAGRHGSPRVAWDGDQWNYSRLPASSELDFDESTSYVHFTSNETIQGIQYSAPPETGELPLVCDASSDFLGRPIQVERFGLLYAGAQCNAGVAGVTILIIREDLLERSTEQIHGYLNYQRHAAADSLYNTPCTYGIYVLVLMTEWLLQDIGGLEKMEAHNRTKAEMLYQVIDESGGFYSGHADPQSRSQMNVNFRLQSKKLEKEFCRLAEQHRLFHLQGHHSIGGLSAYINNAMPLEGVELLRDVMRDFHRRYG